MRLDRMPPVYAGEGDILTTVAAFNDTEPCGLYVQGMMFVSFNRNSLNIYWTEGVRANDSGAPDLEGMYPEFVQLLTTAHVGALATIIQ